MRMKRFSLAILLVLALLLFGSAMAAEVKFRNVSLHDPSVIKADGT